MSARHRIALVAVLVASGAATLAAATPTAKAKAGAASVPERPEKLAYPAFEFQVPRAEAFRHELPGGVVVYVVPDHALPLVDVVLHVRTGAYREPGDAPGLAELTATLMRVGGTESSTPAQFDEKADYLAADLATGSSETTSTASLDVLASGLGEGLDLLFDMVRHPRFDADRLAVEKGKILEEMKQRNDDPDAILTREWRWLLYGRDSIVARKITRGQLDAVTPATLADFYRRTWGPERMVVSVSGDVEPEQILPELERRIAGWRAAEPVPWPPTLAPFTPTPGLYRVEKDVPQGKVRIGHRTFTVTDWSNPDLYAIDVMDDILGGGGFTSRLMKTVRSNEGLAYGASSGFGFGTFWPSSFAAGFASKSPTVAYALELVLREIDSMRTTEVTAEELQTSKSSFVETFPRHFESAAEIAATFSVDELIGRSHDYWYDYRKRIQAVTADDVLRVAQQHLHPDQFLVLVVGNWSQIAPGDPQGHAKMSQFGDWTALPLRDPLTLEPLPPRP